MTAQEYFTEERFKRFEKAYNKAVKEGRDSFIFDGEEYLTSYAKYVIEYLKSKLNNHTK